MEQSDLTAAAEIYQATFVRQSHSLEWLQCNLNAFPRYMMFVAQSDSEILGFITWAQKSGFRREVVLELELLAVKPSCQGKGVGKKLIVDSLPLVKTLLASKDAVLKHVLVTTRADNYAQELYKNALGAEIEATISNLYSADEVLMIARNVGAR
ncbi:GCN5-related N-acetyltransferase [Vibrio ichthyoenteri ATCC 700023]|uniref:GCN5-related N-acetyltransferase n=1 Tax=Vibrio ichthyoenteri ATCC 700023 TaxID=870968 RepID=F9S7X7_9VIBR|nr:GNAT family N-acetyltransferase [Vibrio ichthyoenteri]EGU30712.1 GCN5-related N-acetyltransferase [Vibrio ichthyoenteri ATCC 700023]